MNLLRKIFLILSITVLFFLSLDFIITFTNGYRGASKFYITSKYAGFIHKPDFSGKFGGFLDEYSSNINMGHMGERLSVINNCNYSKNIIFLGDSGTAGFEVNDNETFVSQINLNQCKYKGINFGVRGHNTHNILGNYKRIKEKINHDIVIYIIFPNDLIENIQLDLSQNLYKKFGNIFDEIYYPPKLSNSEKIYHSFRTFIADNFYVTTKLIFCLETKGRICFLEKNKNTDSNKEIIKISQKEINKMNNLIHDLSKETNSIGKKLYVAGLPCLPSQPNEECQIIELENYLKKISNETNLFKVIPLSNHIYEEHKNGTLDIIMMGFRIDSHLSKFGHSAVSKFLIRFLERND